MFEQLVHDIKTVLESPIETQEFKIGLIHEMIDKTIERKTFSEPPNFIQPKAYNRKEEN